MGWACHETTSPDSMSFNENTYLVSARKPLFFDGGWQIPLASGQRNGAFSLETTGFVQRTVP